MYKTYLPLKRKETNAKNKQHLIQHEENFHAEWPLSEMESGIDEIEEAKAVQSIISLETNADDSCREEFEDSDILVEADNSANVTHSLYDVDESLRSTDIENASESTAELKEKDLDSMDGEHSTSIVNVSSIQSHTERESLPQTQETTNEKNETIIEKSAKRNLTPHTSPSKIVYVTVVPKSTIPSGIVPTVTTAQLPPKTISILTQKSKYEKAVDKIEKTAVKMAVDEATTSNINSGMLNKPIGHTVNLLNNNRILIKSVKTNHTIVSAHQFSQQSSSSANEEIPNSSHKNINIYVDANKKVANDLTNEIIPQTENVKPIEENDQQQKNIEELKLCSSTTATTETSDKWVDDESELEIKKELLMNENSNEQQQKVNDHTKLNAIEDEECVPINKKIKREFERFKKMENDTDQQPKKLNIMVEKMEHARRPTKSGKTKPKYNDSSNEMNDEKITTHSQRSTSPSSNSVRSASKESDRSASSSFNSGAAKRNTRSMNTDFSAKQKQFLKGIQQVTRGTDDETDNNSTIDDDDDDLDYFTKQQPNINERRKSTAVNKQTTFANLETKCNQLKTGWDKYCWRCHQADTNLFCSTCIRSYHANCLKMKLLSTAEMNKWPCPECVDIKMAEKENKKKKFDVKHFNKLLKYAMNRILQDSNLQQFQFPVNKTQNPGYSDVILNPINLSKIENNIDNLVYTNSEAFLSDIKWILHNCSIYFSDNYKVTRAAKSLQKVSKQEVGDIETCPECYLNANTMTDNWFTETCTKPHLILWAKLKGFPYWPAKAMSINSTLVDVRFFGEHDRANIPAKDCYLYSREDPNPPTNKYKRNTIADCVKEVDIYIDNIIAKYGQFNYAELKKPFNPQMAEQHLFDMIPGLRSARGRRRSSTARPDLTLKIVKTADNHLSVVKKDQISKELPQIKRTVDITGEETVSRTPTPPSAVLARRKTSDTRIKRTKSTNRHSEGKLTTLDHKSYQVMRRKSMAIEKLDQKRVSAIHSTLDLNLTSESADVSFVGCNSKSKNEKIETDLIAKAVAAAAATTTATKKSNKVAAKKRKLSVDLVTKQINNATEIAEKNSKLDEPTTSLIDDKTEENAFIETNILSSVGLMKKAQAPSQTPEKQPLLSGSSISSSKSVQNENSRCDENDKNNSSARTHTDTNQRGNSKDDTSPIMLVPFIDIKKEPEAMEGVSTGSETPTASQSTISLSSSTENTPAKTYNTFSKHSMLDDNISTIKTESSSDDDSLMIIEDDLSSSTTSSPAKSTPNIDKLLNNIRVHSSISVKDINKMTLQNQQQNARKSFPKGSTSNATTSILKPRNNPPANKPATMNQTNMVCIPLDGLPRLDLTYNSTQPPPLSVVGSANSVSLLAQNQSLLSNTSSTTTATNLTNGPPPLSITSIPTVVNVSQQQPSLLNSNSINTISNGMITEQLASAVTDQIIRRNPPQLTARPAAPLRSECDSAFPSEAGSLCKTLMENSHKMTDFFRSVIEDTLSDLANMSNPEAKIRILELELEKQKNAHAKEIADIRANTDRLLAEMKKTMEKERIRLVNETRKQCELERIRSVDEAKKKQWCANCLKEAQFYCCWNTSYCNHICQRKHWEQHMTNCVQMETSQNVQNSRKPTRTAAKPDGRVQIQTQPMQHQKPQATVQKECLNAPGNRAAITRIANNSGNAPGLRNILPKNALTSINQTRNVIPNPNTNPVIQTQAKPSQQQCIIVGRSLPNWAGSTSKSLLHSNTIFLPQSQPYATITNVQSGSSAGVSLLSTSHAQGQKSNPTETIIIP